MRLAFLPFLLIACSSEQGYQPTRSASYSDCVARQNYSNAASSGQQAMSGSPLNYAIADSITYASSLAVCGFSR